MKVVFLSLGSNLGLRHKNIKTAISFIEKIPKTNLVLISKIYETKPWKVPDKQRDYLNCCLKLKTDLTPYILFNKFQMIESKMGRKRKFRYCSRNIDIDILLFEKYNYFSRTLTIPHPKMFERNFVMTPLKEIISKEDILKLNIFDKN